MRFRIESTVEKRIRVKIMISVLGNFIHILLASSVYCLKYAEPVCANIPQPQVKCTFNNDCKTDQLVFAHVVSALCELLISSSIQIYDSLFL